MKNIFGIVLLVSFLGSCGNADKNSESSVGSKDESKANNEVAIDQSSGFVDITLPIQSIDKKDSFSIIHVLAQHNGIPVGFNVTVPNNPKSSGFGDGLIISTSGSQSDQFLKMLCELFQLTYASNSKFCSADTVAYVDLNKMGAMAGGKNVSGNSMKIFFEKEGKTEEDSKYAEVYLNIDWENKTVSFNEKDSDYRKDLVDFLTEQK